MQEKTDIRVEIQETTMPVTQELSSVVPRDEEAGSGEIREEQQERVDAIQERKDEEGEEKEKTLAAVTDKKTQEHDPAVVISKEREEVVTLEEGFATLEAQIAYYFFMKAMYNFDVKTGKGAREARIAMDIVKEHHAEMSLDKLFSILLVLFGKVLEKWSTSEESFDYEESSVDREISFVESERVIPDADESNTTEHQGEWPPQGSTEVFGSNFENIDHQKQRAEGEKRLAFQMNA